MSEINSLEIIDKEIIDKEILRKLKKTENNKKWYEKYKEQIKQKNKADNRVYYHKIKEENSDVLQRQTKRRTTCYQNNKESILAKARERKLKLKNSLKIIL